MYRHLFLRGVSSVAIAGVLAGSLPHSLQAKVVSQSSPGVEQKVDEVCQEERSRVSRIEEEIRPKIAGIDGLEDQLTVALDLISRLKDRIHSGGLTPERLDALQQFVLELENLVQDLLKQIRDLVADLQPLLDQLQFAKFRLTVCLANNSGPTPGVQDNHPSHSPTSQEFDFDGASSAASLEGFRTIDQALKQAQAILGSH